MKESFEKINDYTIAHVVELADAENSHYNTNEKHRAALTRVFNFEAAQITTIGTSATVTYPRPGYSGGSGTSDSMQVVVTDFADLSSSRELQRMHAQLKKMGGKPPALDDIIGGIHKKSSLGSLRNG
ncbi:MAG TPA: hypothetical protein VHP34_08250 [Alphaproteobacteria bacterium]|jgi:hypothetical protein|nr:hypothetical protein [Alphaproteobacteria bacterium]